MYGKLSVWISVLVVATALALGGNAEANTLSHVSTRIIPNFNNSGSDVCFVHNSNNVPVSAIISVLPIGTAVTGIDDWTFPITLSAFGGARVFSWTPPRHAGSCKVLSVQ
jgi:hypothetical protein